MPYPAQVDRQSIIAEAHQMIEAEGVEALSLAKLARALGIKAPSLYGHLRDKTELLREVNTLTVQQLSIAVQGAVQAAPPKPHTRFLALALAYRAFAHANPRTYMLSTTSAADELRPPEEIMLGVALPLQAVIAEISGEANSLPALRGAYGLVHGFVMLELTNQLRRGGDLETAFVQSVEAYLRGWEANRKGD
ncbi:MAG: TetR/AcrR family transcriptional regulator [Anaerolineales bacterium]|nr:TetR/AcrR family transcriptional regulator [Anaerolineales bacterium]